MQYLDPYKSLEDSIEIILEAPEFDDPWVRTVWTAPPKNLTEARRMLKRDASERNDEKDQLDGIAWYVKG